jgi:hypothetical protein
MVTSLINDIYRCQLLSSDKCTIPERIQREREREREREGQFLLDEVEEQVVNTSRK